MLDRTDASQRQRLCQFGEAETSQKLRQQQLRLEGRPTALVINGNQTVIRWCSDGDQIVINDSDQGQSDNGDRTVIAHAHLGHGLARGIGEECPARHVGPGKQQRCDRLHEMHFTALESSIPSHHDLITTGSPSGGWPLTAWA
eukprot:2116233-Prymnesium_polylepis.4